MNQSFFLIVEPGLEELALAELEKLSQHFSLSLTEIKIVKGGLEFQGETSDVLALQPYLKISSRLLMRLMNFRCKDMPKLFQKLSAYPWRHFLVDKNFQVKASSTKSRLKHTGKLEEVLREAVALSLKQQAPKKRKTSDIPPAVYLRVEEDEAFVSLDASGQALYERDLLKKSGHRAALKTHYAAATLLGLKEVFKEHKSVELIDPMCGSGTFLTEAMDFSKPHAREYASDFWAEDSQKPLLKNFDHSPLALWPELSLIGNDLSSVYLKNKTFNSHDIKFLNQDAFELNLPPKTHGKTRLIISNPPYGSRLAKTFAVKDLLELYRHKLEADGVALVCPRSWDFEKLVLPKQLIAKYQFRNGGLAVQALIINFQASSSFNE